jgi:hypothetical protein
MSKNASTVSITLGGKEFQISRLTIRQSRDLRIGDAETLPDDGVGGWTVLYDSCMRKISVATRASQPPVTEEELWQLQATEAEMLEACRKILVFAGFKEADQTIAELRAMVAAKKKELSALEQRLADREEKAKQTGEG